MLRSYAAVRQPSRYAKYNFSYLLLKMNTKVYNMSIVDIADLFKVLGASLGAVFFAQIDLVTVMSISEALEYMVKMSVLISSLIYTIYKIRDVRRKEDDRTLEH